MSLLQIPRELRDKILSLVVLSTMVTPPESPDNPGDREELKDVKCNGWFAGCGVFYQKDTQMKGIPTLAINQQLRSETLSIMTLLKLPGLRSYKLDVMIVEDCDLWPTWLYVPTMTTRVEEVRATFRIHGASPRRYCGFSGGDGGPPVIVWSFYNLLERFLQVGPVSRQEKLHDKCIKIKHLVLDFQTPSVPEEMIAPDVPQNRLAILRRRSGINYIKNPSSVLAFVSGFLCYLSGCSGPGIVSVAYERVGKITLMLDGVVLHERIASNCIFPDLDAPGLEGPTHRKLEPVFEEWELRYPIEAVTDTE
ncbi:hypothetical protein BKA65DRAFT_293137 [Rhexocercosporidium sp. MPI-PUGE-AT-0058]|nr:hypothetical protein BKA65DRAFT_293137 [Rhexocercosporidium sp. MPI-PUGE-AT-0058]